MRRKTQKTTWMKSKNIERKWYVVDVSQYNLGRIATYIATVLTGKHKSSFVNNIDNGDWVVVVNAKNVKFSTDKRYDTKFYIRHSGYPSGLKVKSLRKMISEKPTEVVKWAVSRMLPKNKMRDKRLSRLVIFEENSYKAGDNYNGQKLIGISTLIDTK